MDPVSISGRQGQTVTSARSSRNNNNNGTRDQWNGYEWNIPLDEVFDCDSAPECCQKFYYKHRNTSKKTKVVIAFVIVAISVIITALVVRFSLGPVNVLLGAGDQRPIVGNEDNFSPLLCSQYKVTASSMISNPVPSSSPSSSSTSLTSSLSSMQSLQSASNEQISDDLRFTAYMLLDTPYKNYHTISYIKEEEMVFPNDNYLNYWAFYLNSGSQVTTSLCAANRTEIKLKIVQGRNKIDGIIKNGDIPETADHVFEPCRSHQQNSYRFSVNSGADDFGFVFTLEETGGSDEDAYTIPVSFSVRRSALVFEKHALYDVCKEKVQCSLPMPNQAEAVMLFMKENATTWPINIRADCVPDIGMYCAFFFGIPVGVAVILLSCAGVLYLCEQSILRDIERADRLRNTMASRSSSFGGRSSSQGNRETSTNSTTTRRSFRTTTSPRAPLVDHDVMSAMAEASRQRDLPPLYGDIKRVSTALSDNDRSQSENDEPPPSYDSVAT